MSKFVPIASKDIDGRIAKLHTSGQRLQTEMHKIACSVLYHCEANRDVRYVATMVGKMVAAMPQMARGNALRQWFEAHAPLKFEKDDTILFDREAAKEPGAFKLAEGIAKPFWEFKGNEGGAYIPLDLQKMFDRLVKSLEKDAKETSRDHATLIAHISSMKEKFTAPAAQ